MQEIGKTGIFPEYFPSFSFSLIFRKSWTSKGFFSNENPLPLKRSCFPGDRRLGIICIPWISGAKAGKQRDELSEGTEPAGNTGKGEKPGKAFPSSQKKKDRKGNRKQEKLPKDLELLRKNLLEFQPAQDGSSRNIQHLFPSKTGIPAGIPALGLPAYGFEAWNVLCSLPMGSDEF